MSDTKDKFIDEFIELTEKYLNQLTKEYNSDIDKIHKLEKEIATLTQQLEIAREGLAFYANCKSQNNWDDFWKDIEDDGKIAKETLAKLNDADQHQKDKDKI